MTMQSAHLHRKAEKGELKIILSAGQQTPRAAEANVYLVFNKHILKQKAQLQMAEKPGGCTESLYRHASLTHPW